VLGLGPSPIKGLSKEDRGELLTCQLVGIGNHREGKIEREPLCIIFG